MTITILLPALVAIVGALVYLLAKTNTDLKELGRISFFVGLLWLVYALSGKTFRF